MNKKRIFIFAGEQSGDLHGSHIIEALSGLEEAEFEGVGGPAMRKKSFSPFLRTEDFEVMGFVEILKKLPLIFRQFFKVRNRILIENYDAVVLIDYPGFNTRLAYSLRKKGYKGKIIQYISPGIWRLSEKQVNSMAKNLNLLLSIFPFEIEFFKNSSVPVVYTGHPLAWTISEHKCIEKWKEACGLDPTKQILAIFPGSRKTELQGGLREQLIAARMVQQTRPEIQIAVSCAREEHYAYIQTVLAESGIKGFIVLSEFRYELMKCCRAALAASGTVTLELALHKVPTVVTYQVSPLNRLIVKYLVRPRLRHFCIVNIIGNREIFPEFIENNYTPKILAAATELLYGQSKKRAELIADCQQITDSLKSRDAYKAAAREIEKIIS